MKYFYVLQHGWILETLVWVKEARHNRSHIVWFYLCEISRISKFIGIKNRLMVVSRWWLHNIVNVLNVAWLYDLKWLKCKSLLCEF